MRIMFKHVLHKCLNITGMSSNIQIPVQIVKIGLHAAFRGRQTICPMNAALTIILWQNYRILPFLFFFFEELIETYMIRRLVCNRDLFAKNVNKYT